VEDTDARLKELSDKAQERNDDYAIWTARRAAEAVERKRHKGTESQVSYLGIYRTRKR
jgi:hypothetical protein